MRGDLLVEVVNRPPAAEHILLAPRLRGLEHAANRGRKTVPLAGLAGELPAAGRGERVKARPAVVLRGAPFGRNPAALFEALERRVERAVLDQQARRRTSTGSRAQSPARARARKSTSGKRISRSRVPCRRSAARGRDGLSFDPSIDRFGLDVNPSLVQRRRSVGHPDIEIAPPTSWRCSSNILATARIAVSRLNPNRPARRGDCASQRGTAALAQCASSA